MNTFEINKKYLKHLAAISTLHIDFNHYTIPVQYNGHSFGFSLNFVFDPDGVDIFFYYYSFYF